MPAQPVAPGDPAPTRYLHGHHDSVLRSHRWRSVENSAAYLLPHLSADTRLLDVGCGPGTITTGFAALTPEGQVVGVDTETAVLEEARARPEAARPNLRFATGDVYGLDFPDGAFDVVHAHQVLQHLTDPVAALAEMRRVCRTGGLVAVREADFAAMSWFPRSDALGDWQALYRRVARSAGGEPDAGRHLLAWARLAGFSRVRLGGGTWCFATPEERRWWGELWAERLVASRFAEQARSAGLAAPEDLERLAAGWRAWAGEDDGCFFVVHGELLCTP